MNPTDDLSPEQQKRVEDIRKALEAEMLAPKNDKRKVITEVEELKEDALGALKGIVKHSQNESLKAKVSMWAVDRILESEKLDGTDMGAFIAELTKVSDASNT
jgi:hypothetical protein